MGLRIRRYFISIRTAGLLQFDMLRLRARVLRMFSREVTPTAARLHFGCGRRRVPGWLNVDVVGSEYDVDLASGRLPWKSGTFDVAVSQHFIEHIDPIGELPALLAELRRVLKPGAQLWLSTPDMAKLCRAYEDGSLDAWVADRRSRHRGYKLGPSDSLPLSYFVNDMFHQSGEHKCLYDLALLQALLEQAGFQDVSRQSEARFIEQFPDFPLRNDDFSSLYVCAVRSTA